MNKKSPADVASSFVHVLLVGENHSTVSFGVGPVRTRPTPENVLREVSLRSHALALANVMKSVIRVGNTGPMC